MNFLLLAAEAPKTFFYENWIIIKQLIWLFGKFMDGIMYVLDQMGIYNIALCIVIFTFVTKMVLLPLTIKQQKVTRLNAYINPEIQAIQKKYKNKTDQASQQKMIAEQQAVQEKYGVSMSAGCLPTLIQFPILFALYPVIYNMEKYVSYLNVLKEKLSPETLSDMYNLLGIDLSAAPGYKFSIALLIPILTALSQFFCSKIMSAQQDTGDNDNPMAASLKGMNLIMPIMLGIFAVSMPAFLGFYWIVQSLIMLAQQLLINKRLNKIPVEQMIAENIEKANKKRAKKGMPPLGDKATIATKNIAEKKTSPEEEAKLAAEKQEQARKAEEYYRSRSAAPGSLSAKANMVRDYNEKNKK